jgi:hypothetical protein
MTTFQDCPGICSLVLSAESVDGDTAQNVLHCGNGTSGAWTLAQLTTLVNAVDTWLTTGAGGHTWPSMHENSATMSLITARDLTTDAGPEYNKAVAHDGTLDSGPLAIGLAKALTLRSGLSGRSYRGRVYEYGFDLAQQSATDSNAMDATVLANFETFWGALITAVSGAGSGWLWGVLSREHNGSTRANGIITAIASVGHSHVYFDFQRRRAPDHARHG